MNTLFCDIMSILEVTNMFFSQLFKNKKGNVEKVSEGIFNIAVVLNIVCLATSIMLLVGCFFVETKNIETLIIAAIIILAGCYIVEVYLAWTSAILNKKEKVEKIEDKKIKITKKETK